MGLNSRVINNSRIFRGFTLLRIVSSICFWPLLKLSTVQHFEWKLSEEVLAQAKYYHEQGGGAGVWSDILHPGAEAGDSPDNVSLQSCPVTENSNNNVTNVTFLPHHKRTKSACSPIRPPRSNRPLSHQLPSSSSYSSPLARPVSTPPLHSSRYSLTSSQPSLVPQSPPVPRPQSLYVPFVGCVDAPRAPPGQAAREILQAMSFAPTHDSFASSDDNQPPVVPPRTSRMFRSPRLRSKSSSLASLISAVSPKMSKRFDSNISISTSSLIQPVPTLYSPCHPVNNCELNCVKLTHPPVIHPPPDLVQMTSSTTPSSFSPQVSRNSQQSPLMFDYQNPNALQSQLEMIRESSPYQSS